MRPAATCWRPRLAIVLAGSRSAVERSPSSARRRETRRDPVDNHSGRARLISRTGVWLLFAPLWEPLGWAAGGEGCQCAKVTLCSARGHLSCRPDNGAGTCSRALEGSAGGETFCGLLIELCVFSSCRRHSGRPEPESGPLIRSSEWLAENNYLASSVAGLARPVWRPKKLRNDEVASSGTSQSRPLAGRPSGPSLAARRLAPSWAAGSG